MPIKRTYPRTQHFLLSLQLAGDFVFCFAGLCFGYFVRFETPVYHVGVEGGEDLTIRAYLPLLVLGALFFLFSFSWLKVYDARLLLRPHRGLSIILRAVAFWFVAFLSASLALKFEPPISRLFVVISCVTTFLALVGWRLIFHYWLERSRFRDRMAQRIAIVGWTEEAKRLVRAITNDKNHPYLIAGVVDTHIETSTAPGLAALPILLGSLEGLERIIREHLIDIVVVADMDLPKEPITQIATLCERNYVDFKITPSFFQIFISNLELQTISGLPILGIEDLRARHLHNLILKRTVDILGASIGLLLASPIIAILALNIKREGGGPVIFRQRRTGMHGTPFEMYKLRSMRMDAESAGGAQWATPEDPRRTKIGAFMRRFNLDELPQFWNVLKGEMSLVGPRPERPELIASFEQVIPHYNPRHEVRPGMTGWAQVNGLRGNTSLLERIKYDLYYIENWSLVFDLQIMLLTFVRRHNAY